MNNADSDGLGRGEEKKFLQAETWKSKIFDKNDHCCFSIYFFLLYI